MIISPTCRDNNSLFGTRSCESLCIRNNFLCIGSKCRFAILRECNSFCSHHLWKRSAQDQRATLVDMLCKLLCTQNHPSSWTTKGFMRCRGYNMRISNRIMHARKNFSRNKTSEMCHVYHKHRASFVGNLSHTFEINMPWICAITNEENQRLYFQRHFF